jgi:glycine C-acetyltransferase
MHGRVAPVPELMEVCRRHAARLMVDDAHGLGVMGSNGRGIEEHFGIEGQVDVLMGTLSKAVGCLGGYVTGNRELVNYLRWFAASAMFTTALPAPLCAGMREALRVARSEPQHREALWENTHYFVRALRQVGFDLGPAESPIVTLFVGRQALLLEVSRDLFDAGIKCGNVMFPAVPRDEAILRFTLNARHSREDLDYTVERLERIGKRTGLLEGRALTA